MQKPLSGPIDEVISTSQTGGTPSKSARKHARQKARKRLKNEREREVNDLLDTLVCSNTLCSLRSPIDLKPVMTSDKTAQLERIEFEKRARMAQQRKKKAKETRLQREREENAGTRINVVGKEKIEQIATDLQDEVIEEVEKATLFQASPNRTFTTWARYKVARDDMITMLVHDRPSLAFLGTCIQYMRLQLDQFGPKHCPARWTATKLLHWCIVRLSQSLEPPVPFHPYFRLDELEVDDIKTLVERFKLEVSTGETDSVTKGRGDPKNLSIYFIFLRVWCLEQGRERSNVKDALEDFLC